MNKVRVIGIGIGVLLIFAALGVVVWQGMNMPSNSVAFAQAAATATPAATAAPTTAPSTAPSTAPQQQQQTIGDDFWNALATKLGVSASDLKAKAVQTRQGMIDQAVKDGRITQAQADAIKQRITSNNIIQPIQLPGNGQGNFPGRGFGPRGPFGNPGPGNGNGNQNPGNGNKNPAPFFGNGFPGMRFGQGMFGGSLQDIDALAQVLKLDANSLIQQLAQGKTLADIAKAQSVDEATVKKAIIDARTAQIDKLLSYGLISQVQADQMKAQLTPDKIDLTRPLFFQFRTNGTAPKSSEMLPEFGATQTMDGMMFDMQGFGDTFGMYGGMNNDGSLQLPQDIIQTQ